MGYKKIIECGSGVPVALPERNDERTNAQYVPGSPRIAWMDDEFAPSGGYWKAGDLALCGINGVIGHVCTQEGNPGTWTQIAATEPPPPVVIRRGAIRVNGGVPTVQYDTIGANVAKNGIGDYSVVFTQPFANAQSYVCASSVGNDNYVCNVVHNSADSIQVKIHRATDGVAIDTQFDILIEGQ